MSENRFSRQMLMFGPEGQRKIDEQRVCLVGLGGVGSHIAQGLAYLGVSSLSLVDDDRIDETSLNRVVGAKQADIGRLKVEVAREQILQIRPSATVTTLPKNLRTNEAFALLRDATAIFGNVDHDGPRLVLTEFSAAYRKPLIDTATEIFPEAEGRPFDFGGRVVIARPGEFCLFCANQIDREMAKVDLESPEVRALRKKHGYGLGDENPAPSVCALNGVVANLAIIEFICLVTGVRDPERLLKYKATRGVVTASDDRASPDCYTCKCVCGQGDKANVARYLIAG